MKLQLDRFSLGNSNIVISFSTKPDIILRYGNIFSNIASELKGTVTQVAVPPNAQPEYPRLVIGTSQLQLKISLSSIEVALPQTFNNNGPVEQNIDQLKDRLDNLKVFLSRVFDKNEFKQNFIGLLTSVQFPQDGKLNSSAITQMLIKRLVGSKNVESWPLNFNWSLGYPSENENAFINFAVKAYELKEIKVLNNPQNRKLQVAIDVNQLPITDSGVEVVFDINNRPQKNKGQILEDLNSLFSILKTEVNSQSLQKRIFFNNV